MFFLIALLCSFVSHRGGQVHLMRLSREIEFDSPISCPPGFEVIEMCHDDHQKVKGFLTGHGSWDFAPHLVCGGATTCVMATWHVLISGVNAPVCMTLGFPAEF